MYFWDGRRLTDFPLCQGVPAKIFERSIEKVHWTSFINSPNCFKMEFGLFFVYYFVIVMVTFMSLFS